MMLPEPAAPFYIRPFEPPDIAPFTQIINAIYPDEPTTVAQNEHWETSYPADNPRFRRVATTDTGAVVGYGECQYPFWSDTTDTYALFIAVHPEWQHQGIGRALFTAVSPFASQQGASRLKTDCKEDDAGAIRFLKAAGFTRIGIRFESALAIATFDETPFQPALNRATTAGYEITTLAQARQTDPEADLKLFDVFAATIVDVPFPGGDRALPNYEHFRAGLLDAPNSDANALFIARTDGQMVGMTSLELLPNKIAITGMTGVLAPHRGKGVAMALKVHSFRFLQAHGYTEARTHNDTANPAILALNDKLGYRPLSGWLVWEKSLI